MLDKNNLEHNRKKSACKIVMAGHVDDGKSTLIGRLLYETDSFPEGKLDEIKLVCDSRNMSMEWSFVLDAFQAERDQAVTIDSTRVLINNKFCNVQLIDVPGHKEFLKNMISGAAAANAAFLLLDATQGVREQTRRHAYFLKLLGINQFVVLVNKMDLIDYSEFRFEKVSSEIMTCLKDVEIEPSVIIPISARHGDSLTKASNKMPWFKGPTVLEVINRFSTIEVSDQSPLRFPVQDVYKFDERRIIVGRIESGILQVGDELVFLPSQQTAKVNSIEVWNALPCSKAASGDSIGIVLDKELFIERGDIASHLENQPTLSNSIRARVFWLGNDSLEPNKIYKLRHTTRETLVTVQSIEFSINTDSFEKNKVSIFEKNQCGEVILRFFDLLAIDESQKFTKTGRFVLIDKGEIVAGGMVLEAGQLYSLVNHSSNLTKVFHYISKQDRESRNVHKGAILWFTGLSGSGKSTIAMALEKLLFLRGYQAYTLDGDNIRSGLNSDLGFSAKDRAENIRRVANMAALFADAGFICIVAFISPYLEDRLKARNLVSEGVFHEVFINADLQTCELRDPKGLYKKARKGEISDFTGISAPYETPINPELLINTMDLNMEQCVNKLMGYIKLNFDLSNQNYIEKELGILEKV